MENMININDPIFLRGVMQNIEQRMKPKERKQMNNWFMVQMYLFQRTSTSGSKSCWAMCEYMGVDPEGYTFF